MNTVRALVLRKYGGPGAPQLALIAPPVAASGQVLVRVHAVGISTVRPSCAWTSCRRPSNAIERTPGWTRLA